MTADSLFDLDRAIVEIIAARTLTAGATAIESSLRIHRQQLGLSMGKRLSLLTELADVERSIAMRELAIELLTAVQPDEIA